MYYHARPFKYVVYGKVEGNPDPGDPDFEAVYRWLAAKCGYFPQVWLSRSHSIITGMRETAGGRKVVQKARKSDGDQVMFAFQDIQGFPVAYDPWHWVMGPVMGWNARNPGSVEDSIEEIDRKIWKGMVEIDHENERAGDEDPYIATRGCRSFEEWLDKVLFVKMDQVVVPSLNLKAAKKVYCKNEKQKKSLRKMGFIEDRIEIRRFHPMPW
jgi:hypothetical protein